MVGNPSYQLSVEVKDNDLNYLICNMEIETRMEPGGFKKRHLKTETDTG